MREEFKYRKQPLVQIAKKLLQKNPAISIDGNGLTISDFSSVLHGGVEVKTTQDTKIRDQVQSIYALMIKEVEAGVPIYGVNTGYGGQASWIVNQGTPKQRIEMAKKISEGIVHVDVTTGPAIPKEITRLAMTIRANMLMKGVSAVRLEDIEHILKLVNKDIIPVVGSYGGLGASGDLPQNGRVLSVLRQLAHTKVWGESGFVDGPSTLKKHNIPPMKLEPKVGLGMVNGDNFSTAYAFYIAQETTFALITQSVTSALMYEALLATNRSLHPMLAEVRPHQGQKELSAVLRRLTKGSKLIRDEMTELLPTVEGRKVQDVYSIRCLAQFEGVSWERVKWAMDLIEINANSASDNPLWVNRSYVSSEEESEHWISGGNFLATYMVEVIDALRKTLTHIVKLNDRHMARLIDPHENNGLPANLSHEDALSQCAFKGVQAQAGMFDVYSTFLSFPISTLFGIHEQNNQDITAHSITSGIIAKENLRVTYLSLSQTMIALAQAVDLRKASDLISPKTKKLYSFVREYVEFTAVERPLGPDIEILAEKIQTDDFRKMLIEEILV